MAGDKIIVTGGQGFIGSWIIKELLAQDAQPIIFDLKEMSGILEQVLTPEEMGKITRHYGDISDTDNFKQLVLDTKPAAIIHLAGLQIPTCKVNPVLGAKVNVIGTLNVFESVKALAEATKEPPIPIVYASSAAVLGPKEDYPNPPVPDDYYHKPATIYGVFKLCNEGTGRLYWQDHKISSVGLRPLTCFGVGREIGLTSSPTKAIKSAVLGRPYVCSMTGESGFSYARDVARAFVGCARAKVEGAPVFNIRGEVTTAEAFLEKLAAVIPEAKDLVTVDGKVVPIMADVDESGLVKLLNTIPEPYQLKEAFPLPLEASIKETADLFRQLQSDGRLHDKDL